MYTALCTKHQNDAGVPLCSCWRCVGVVISPVVWVDTWPVQPS